MFSTNLGARAPCNETNRLDPLIVRSAPLLDKLAMVSKLRQKYPSHCEEIRVPVTVADYFDLHDVQLMGRSFLSAVLHEIHLQNAVDKFKSSSPTKGHPSQQDSSGSPQPRHLKPPHRPGGLSKPRGTLSSEPAPRHEPEFLSKLKESVASYPSAVGVQKAEIPLPPRPEIEPAKDDGQAQQPSFPFFSNQLPSLPYDPGMVEYQRPPGAPYEPVAGYNQMHQGPTVQANGGPYAGQEGFVPQRRPSFYSGEDTLFLGNLPPDVAKEEILQAFDRFGRIEDLNLLHRGPTRPFAFLRFSSHDEATLAVCTMVSWMLRGIPVKVSWRKPQIPKSLRAPNRPFVEKNGQRAFHEQQPSRSRANSVYDRPVWNGAGKGYSTEGPAHFQTQLFHPQLAHKMSQMGAAPSFDQLRPRQMPPASGVYSSQDARSSTSQPSFQPHYPADGVSHPKPAYGQYNTVAHGSPRSKRLPFLPTGDSGQEVSSFDGLFYHGGPLGDPEATKVQQNTRKEARDDLGPRGPQSSASDSFYDIAPSMDATLDNGAPLEQMTARTAQIGGSTGTGKGRHVPKASSLPEASSQKLSERKPSQAFVDSEKDSGVTSRKGSATKSQDTTSGLSKANGEAEKSDEQKMKGKSQESKPGRKLSKKKKNGRQASQSINPAPGAGKGAQSEGRRKPAAEEEGLGYDVAFPELGQKAALANNTNKPSYTRSKRAYSKLARNAESSNKGENAQKVENRGAQVGPQPGRRTYSQAAAASKAAEKAAASAKRESAAAQNPVEDGGDAKVKSEVDIVPDEVKA